MRKTDNRRGAFLALASGLAYGAYRMYQSRRAAAASQPELAGRQITSAPNANFGADGPVPVSFDSTPNSTHYLSNPDLDRDERAEPYYAPGSQPERREPSDRD